MSNNRAVEGFWSAGSEGRVIAEKTGVVVAQCLWQEDAELIVALRNNQRVAQLEGAVARVEAAAREAGIHLAPGTPTATQLADAIVKLAADGKRLSDAAKEAADDAETARKGWRDEIALRQQEVETHAETRRQLAVLETRYKELEVKVAGEQRQQAFEERAAHVDGQKRREKR